jgi:pimeloyl-ACP methyl ester carboxylesterase
VHHVPVATTVVSGPPVLFVHGLASRGRVDWPDAEWGTPFAAAGRESFVVDLPVHGASFRPGEPLPPSAIVDLLRDVVHDAGGLVDVVAYSLGSRLAWDLVARGPRRGCRVRRAVLAGLSPRVEFGSVDLDAARRALAGGDPPADDLTRMILAMAQLPGLEPAEVLRLVEGLAREPFDAGAVPDIPLLLLRGADDHLTTGLDQLAGGLPHARYAEIPGDHFGVLHTRRFHTAVTGFVL